MDNTSRVLVTYRRRRSGRLHQIAFECGQDNSRLILKEAHNTNSEIVKVETQDVPAETFGDLIARGITPSEMPPITDRMRRREAEVREGRLV